MQQIYCDIFYVIIITPRWSSKCSHLLILPTIEKPSPEQYVSTTNNVIPLVSLNQIIPSTFSNKRRYIYKYLGFYVIGKRTLLVEHRTKYDFLQVVLFDAG